MLMSMVEGRNLKVLLCYWIDSLAQAIGENREQKVGSYGDESVWFHGDACQH